MSTIFIILSASVVITLLVFFNSKKHRLQENKKLVNQWNDKDYKRNEEPIKSVRMYWNSYEPTKNQVSIDDLTWNDLSMDTVFQKINLTHTSIGAEKLYCNLRSINLNENYFNEKEPFIRALFETRALREEIELKLMALGKKSFTDTSSFLYQITDKFMKHTYLYILLSLLSITPLVLVFVNLKAAIITFFCLVMINSGIYFFKKREYQPNFYSLSYITSIINCGKHLVKIQHKEFGGRRDKIKLCLKKLKKISFWGSVLSSNNSSINLIVDYLRIFFLLDFIAYNRILRTIKNNQESYISLWHEISDLDLAISITHFRNLYPDHCIPTFIEEMKLKGTDLYHPLIKHPVKNNIEIDKDILITGSNASGKSTFIKAVAINCILAQTINTVLAKGFLIKPSHILTSMAISDDVLGGDSYFIAEIKSLKRIIDTIKQGMSCMTFIDEILKGTNTVERISASASILNWINYQKNNLCITASHDIELTQITKDYYEHYHFSETIENNSISFDYKLKKGPSYTRNGIKLLEQLHYPKEIINLASKLANSFEADGNWMTFNHVNYPFYHN
ncbi:hypothetical protein PU629_20645 [Pullulanibacillus sp. KACC 23026]|uniref:MutS-related protein n=1 Tax=Pullulanibacillus sp. KACC 23026 TaxID=3028315 RepID=UPI0023B08C1E|nr:hypothetical protein [Pullulanibacillus sp. KACC 23026]WEG12478.1 hypothetical protein PU629_20645 [Pullulanibacillus sp. KACC 23026]